MDQAILRGPSTVSPDNVTLVHEIFEAVARANEDKIAVIDDYLEVTYRELNRRANKVASHILNYVSSSQATSSPDSDWIVAVCFEPSANLIACLLGILKSGCAYLPLDICFPEQRVRHILADSHPLCTIKSYNHPVLEEVAGDLGVQVFDINKILENDFLEDNPEYVLECDGERVGAVLYTSGSTGTPKGVRVPHRAILSRLNWQWRVFPFEKDEVCCFKTALTFVDSVAEIFAPLLKCVPVVIIPKEVVKDPEELINSVSKYRVSRLVLVPTLLRNILAAIQGPEILKDLKLWVCSGEILGSELVRSFFNVFQHSYTLANFYGSTEVMGDVTFAVMKSWDEAEAMMVDNKIPIGVVVDNCTVYLFKDDQEIVNCEDQGEIYVAGKHVAVGYVGGKSPDKFTKNLQITSKGESVLFRTGDFGRIVKGQLIYEGRADSQIKVRGHRVDLAEIDRLVKTIEGVETSTIVCYRPGELEQEIVAFVVIRQASSKRNVQKELMKLLPQYMIPQVYEVDSLPLLVNGKVDRQGLLKLFAETSERTNIVNGFELDLSTIPNSQVDAAYSVLLTVSDCLGCSLREKLNLDQNFFDIGGNSLNAVRVVTRLKEQGYKLRISDFLRAKSLRNLLDFVGSQDDTVSQMAENSSPTSQETEPVYIMEMLTEGHKEDVLEIIAGSFAKRGDLERIVGVTYEEFYNLMDDIWDAVLEKNLSFAMLTKEGKIASVAINFDAYDEPPIKPEKNLAYVMDFLESVEALVRETRLPNGKGKVFHSILMGTDLTLPGSENIRLIHIMEEEILLLANKREFKCVFTTNTSAATRGVCDDLLDYEVLADIPVTTYVAPDGFLPFASAPVTIRAVATVKWLHG